MKPIIITDSGSTQEVTSLKSQHMDSRNKKDHVPPQNFLALLKQNLNIKTKDQLFPFAKQVKLITGVQ